VSSAAPYRDQFAFIRAIEQHVGIALALLEQYESTANLMLAYPHESVELAEARELARRTWQDLWQQLEQARDLARGAGRVVDDPRDLFSAAAIWNVDGPMVRHRDVHLSNRRIIRRVTWRDGDLVRAAVAALAAAVPEAILSAPPAIALPRSWLARWWWAILLFAIPTLIGLCSP
jgi:hypothetical protein